MKYTMGAFNNVSLNFILNYIELWVKYHDNHDITRYYHDIKMSVIAEP